MEITSQPKIRIASIKFGLDDQGRNSVEVEYQVTNMSQLPNRNPKELPVFSGVFTFPLEGYEYHNTILNPEENLIVEDIWKMMGELRTMCTKLILSSYVGGYAALKDFDYGA